MGIQDIDGNTILEKGIRGYTLEYLDIDGKIRIEMGLHKMGRESEIINGNESSNRWGGPV